MDRRVFVIGNVAWDEPLHLAALPAPGASVHVRRGSAGLGGKGANQAVTLARAGVPVTLIAAIGRDARGEAATAALAAEGLAEGLIAVDAATDCSVVLVTDAGENAVLTTRDAALSLDGGSVETALTPAAAGDLCLLQGNLAFETTAAAMAAAKARGMAIAFNPSPPSPEFAALFASADLLALNRDEAARFGDATLAAGAALVTLGADGAVLSGRHGAAQVAAAPAAVFDPTGAGDAFLGAALAVARARGWRLDAAALKAGARAAALTIGRAGAFAALPTRAELAALIAAR